AASEFVQKRTRISIMRSPCLASLASTELGMSLPVREMATVEQLIVDVLGPTRSLRRQQPQRLDAEPLGQPLDRLQGQVALASLHRSQVGAVIAQVIGEGFLAEPPLLPAAAQIPA